jgi:type II secretory pathway component PulJ
VRHGEVVLPYRVYDKMQRINQAEIVENKRLAAALAMAQAMQAANPHHRQRNNNAPVRSSQSVGIFASPRQEPAIFSSGVEPSKRRGRPPLPFATRCSDTPAAKKQKVR